MSNRNIIGEECIVNCVDNVNKSKPRENIKLKTEIGDGMVNISKIEK